MIRVGGLNQCRTVADNTYSDKEDNPYENNTHQLPNRSCSQDIVNSGRPALSQVGNENLSHNGTPIKNGLASPGPSRNIYHNMPLAKMQSRSGVSQLYHCLVST